MQLTTVLNSHHRNPKSLLTKTSRIRKRVMIDFTSVTLPTSHARLTRALPGPHVTRVVKGTSRVTCTLFATSSWAHVPIFWDTAVTFVAHDIWKTCTAAFSIAGEWDRWVVTWRGHGALGIAFTSWKEMERQYALVCYIKAVFATQNKCATQWGLICLKNNMSSILSTTTNWQ